MSDSLNAPPVETEPTTGPVVLRVEDVHIAYRVHSDRHRQLRDRLLRKESSWTKVHAVKGVTFDLREGEILGIVGANGSGKSSLLRAIAGLLPVTGGGVFARSRPVLLGVGSVLRPDLSGRRNIHIGLLALGLPAREVRGRIDDIIEFSGLSESIDFPLRTYSSGMRARLQFAIATAVVPDLLLIDEALAVGDAEFKERSKEHLRWLREHAGAVILVSHSRKDILDVCARAIWLRKGVVRAHGEPEAVFDAYGESAGGRQMIKREENRERRARRLKTTTEG